LNRCRNASAALPRARFHRFLPRIARRAQRASRHSRRGISVRCAAPGYGVIKLAKPFPETWCMARISCPAGWERSRCHRKNFPNPARSRPKTSPDRRLRHRRSVLRDRICKPALIMGEARGAAHSRPIAEAGLEIFDNRPAQGEYRPSSGYGAAQKSDRSPEICPADVESAKTARAGRAADALALACCHRRKTAVTISRR